MEASRIEVVGAGLAARPLEVRDLGLIAYEEAWELQKDLVLEVGSGRAPETLLLLEHPHTYTCGRRGGRDHILIDDAELRSRGIAVLDVDRGGDVTYHGPGQLVAYPIINLSVGGNAVDYPGYVRSLEWVMIGLLGDYAISAHQIAGLSGAWVRGGGEEKKIAAIGVKVDGKGITSHGVAINVTADLDYFRYIVPCGIADKGVTSMLAVSGSAPSMPDLKHRLAARFADAFGFQSRD